MTSHQSGNRFARLTRMLGFKNKSARAAEVVAAQEQARELERTREGEHARSYADDEIERGGHQNLRP